MNLLGKAQDKGFWAEVRERECFAPYIEQAKKVFAQYMEGGDVPALKYSEFKLFFTTGNRAIYEKPYFQRRHYAEAAAIMIN